MATVTPIPENEAERLRALYEYRILDTLPELKYDELTKIAAQICGCPFSTVTFVDKDRQWFKSIFGLKAQETPREGGFCAHAIIENDVFVVRDAHEDERFASHPYVLGAPKIRFYAGAPVSVGKNLKVGVICVSDTKPRILGTEQLESLQAFSRIISSYLDAQQKYTELSELLRQRHESEKFLVHASQMTALAEMSGGMAHEINNPLAIMLGLAYRLKDTLTSGHSVTASDIQTIDRIERAGLRISKIIKALRSFSRDSTTDPAKSISVRTIIDDAVELCRHRFARSGIELRIPSLTDDLKIECKPAELTQVLMNLLNNALDATICLDEKWVEIAVEPGETAVQISIMDSGLGIAEETRHKIFQPFFTTKEVGLGTGLGLSISQGIIQAHQGKLFVDPKSRHTRLICSVPYRFTASDKLRLNRSI